MTRNQKLLSVFLALLMILTIFPMSIIADALNAAIITVESVNAVPGSNVEVDINVKNNPGIMAANFTVTYDEGLTLVDSKSGEAFSALSMTTPESYNSPCKFAWDALDLADDDIKDGTILTLTFSVDESVSANSKLNVKLSYQNGNIIDSNLNDIPVAINNGSVTIIDYIPGDINGDGTVDLKDVTFVRRLVTGYSVTANKLAADVNGDGEVTMKDVVLIRRYVVDAEGYGVTLVPGGSNVHTHIMTATAAKSATCTENGNIAYWYCSACEKYFTDKDGNNFVSQADTILKAPGHTVVIDAAVEPTYDSTGLTEGSHCSVCKTILKKQDIIPKLKKTEYAIIYHITDNDSYLQSLKIDNPNPNVYTSQEGLKLLNLTVDGYVFEGWYDGQGSNGELVKNIAIGTKGNIDLYAKWTPVVYVVQYKSDIFVDKSKDVYTVSEGLTLPTPKLSNYIFTGWTDEKGNLYKKGTIPIGTTGSIILTANWTSERNKTFTKPKLDAPIITEDEKSDTIFFAYEIGEIQNVPVYTIHDFGYISGEGITQTQTETFTTKINDTMMNSFAKSVSNATTKSSNWTLSKDWNEVTSIDEQSYTEKGLTKEQAETIAKSNSSTWNISSGSSGSSSSTKVTTNNDGWTNQAKVDVGISDKSYQDNGLSVKAGLNANMGLKQENKVTGTTGEAGIGGSIEAGGETKWGNEHSTGVNASAGRDTSHSEGSSETAVKSSSWNSSSSKGGSSTNSTSRTTSNIISEKIAKTYGYGKSYSQGGGSSESQGLQSTQSEGEEYESAVTYSKEEAKSTTSTWTTQATKAGYHRWIMVGKAHVFAIVGYDMKTESFFTYTYSVMDDTEPLKQFEDYSYITGSYNDAENGVIPFEVPIEVAEYVAERTCYSKGLKVDQSTGTITGYTGTDDYVVIPEYMNVGGGDVVKITGISSTAFKGNAKIKEVRLSDFITTVPDNAFEGCTSLFGLSGGNILSIGDNAFKNCTSMDIVTVDKNVDYIGINAFEGANTLTINAANVNVVKAAVNSGAKIIDVYVGCIENGADALNGITLTVPSSTEMFSFNGYKDTYNNFSIVSNAAETRIHKTNFVSTAATPLKIDSAKVVLNQVTIKSAGLGLVLKHDNTELGLQGNVTVDSDNVNAVLSKNITLYDSNENVEGKLIVTDKILVCGDITGNDHLQYNQYEQINIETFNNLLNSYTLNFNVNADNASCTESSRKVSNGSPIGSLPIPTRTGFNFDGWFTSPLGGTKVSPNATFTTANDITLYAHWTVKSFSASWISGTGCTIVVTRTSSPNKGTTGVINSGDTVYYGDVLSVKYAALTGYTLDTTGSTSITVTGDVTGSDIYATATVNSYTALWSVGTGYTISVKRISSPKAGAATGIINSGTAVYYGDILNVTYTASTGYTLRTNGLTSITVTGNVTNSDIYATATINSYTYNIVYRSSNGTDLGSSSATYNYGTTNTILPPAKDGYNTPSSQSVTWDSTSAKTIVFTYTPTSQPTRQVISKGNWWKSSSGNTSLDYVVEAEWRNRTANSVEIRIIWTNTITNKYSEGKYGFKQEFEWWGWHQIADASNFKTAGGTRTASNTSGWHTYSCTPDDISQNTGSEWRDNNGKSGSWSGKVYFPKY